MLKNQIVSTLKFFELQDYPLTLLELQQFLIADLRELKIIMDESGEIENQGNHQPGIPNITADEILTCLDNECATEIENHLGFYFLKGRKEIVNLRLQNYFYGIKREKLIRRFVPALKYFPFVRGVALAGSQAMGEQKQTSDIDLLIITEGNWLWLARTLITAYFQIIGQRRHGQNISNRFCLNHYLAGPKEIAHLRNLYTASEYLKLRPLLYEHVVWAFRQNNQWLKILFPNFVIYEPPKEQQPALQKFLEKVFNNQFGRLLEKLLKSWQLPKIRQERFIVVEEDELSFHPDSKQEKILQDFLRAA